MRLARLPLSAVAIVLGVTFTNGQQTQQQPLPETVGLSGGAFVMGTDANSVDALMARFTVKRRELFTSELPAHRVTVSPFFLDRTEVTTAAYRKWHGETFSVDEAELPATFVTWDNATAFCASVGKRLPTEAEWEFAATNGGTTEFPWGNEMPDALRANWLATGIGKPVRVGSFPPSPARIFDLAGNVWEFVQDEWRSDYSPSATASPGRRVIRGGSFGATPANLRSRFRDSHPANSPGSHVGFRCAREGSG